MPLDISLPLLVDMLRGAQDLDAAGISHCGLEAVDVKLAKGRAVLGDLGSATIVGEASGPLERGEGEAGELHLGGRRQDLRAHELRGELAAGGSVPHGSSLEDTHSDR